MDQELKNQYPSHAMQPFKD